MESVVVEAGWGGQRAFFNYFEGLLGFFDGYCTFYFWECHIGRRLLHHPEPGLDFLVCDFVECHLSLQEGVNEVVAAVIFGQSLHDWVVDAPFFD